MSIKFTDLSKESPPNREQWIAAVLDLLPKSEDVTPARRDNGESVVIRIPGVVEADLLWGRQTPQRAVVEIRAHATKRGELLGGPGCDTAPIE